MYRAGIDLGGTNIKAAILDEQNQILAEDSIPTKVQRSYTEIIKEARALNQQSVSIPVISKL